MMVLQRKDKGFTLLEVMISMVFLVIGILGIVSLHFASSAANRMSHSITTAVVMAEEKIEELKRAGYSSPELADTDGMKTDIGTNIEENRKFFTEPDHNDDSRNPGFVRVWNVADNMPDSDVKTVTVIVGWQETRWHYITLSSIIRNREDEE